MICGSAGRSGSRWLLWAGLAVACAVAVVVAMKLQEGALTTRVDEEVAGIESFADQELGATLRGVDLSEPLADSGVAAALAQQLDRGIMSEPATVRIRIFATNGILLYSTDEGDRIGAARIGDPDAVHAAAAGAATSIVSDDAVSRDGGDAQSLRLLQVFAPVPDATGSPGSVVEADLKYRPIENASKQPWSTVMLGAGIAAIVCFVLALFALSARITSRRLAARSGFAAQPGELKKAKKTAEQEAKARAALENQLEALRDQLKELRQSNDAAGKGAPPAKQEKTKRSRKGEEGSDNDPAEGHEALLRIAEGLAQEAEQKRRLAETRAEEAEAESARLESLLAKAQKTEGSDASDAETAEATARLQQELDDLRAEHQSALMRVQELEHDTSALDPTPVPADDADPKLRERLTELEVLAATHAREAAEYRNRAEATDAVKAELETKVAQLASKAEEAERQVAELQAPPSAPSPPVAEGGAGTEHLVAALSAAKAERETLLAKIEAERETVRAQAMAELERIQTEASRNLTSVRDELSAAQGRIVELESAAAARVPAAPEMEKEFEALRLSKEAVEATLADLRATNERLEAEKAGLAEIRDEAERELTEARSQLAGVDERIRQGDELIRQADARAEAAEARFAATSDLSAEVANVRAELEAERDKNRRAEQRAEDSENLQRALEQHGTALANALEEERAARAEVAANVEEATRQLAATEEVARSFEARIAELEGAGRDEVAARTEAERRSEELAAEVERERARAAASETDLSSLRMAESEAREEIDRLRAEQESLRSEAERLGSEQESLRSESERVRAATVEAEAAFVAKTEALEHELASERAAMAEREANLAALRERLDAHGERERELETTIAELQASVATAALKDEKVAELEAAKVASEGALRDRDSQVTELGTRAAEAEAKAVQLETRAAEAEARSVQLEGLVAVAETRAAAAETRAVEAETQVARSEDGASDREARLGAAEARATQAETRAIDADARAATAEARLTQLEPRVAELESRAMAAEQRSSDLEVRAMTAEQRATEVEARVSSEVPAQIAAADDGRIAELERQIDEYGQELEQMQNRLRRAYADAEEARAHLESGGGTAAGLGGGDPDEVARLRRELAQAMERASAAENRSSQLQADLAEARVRAGEDPEQPEPEPEVEEEEGPSLRFRLAQAASRKKGITGGVPGGGADEHSMWS